MIEAIAAGLSNFFTPMVMMFTVIGVLIGLVFGLMPGIGMIPAMAIVLPLTFGMDPAAALCLLVAIQAVGSTGGSITAILLNIPGTGMNAATLIDGFPMTKKGEGGRACGAALCASGLGGIFGAVVLAFLIPVAYPLVMLFGAGETALMALLGLTFIAVLSRGSSIKGFISGLLGIIIGFVGVYQVTGVARFTFGNLYLYEGFPLIPFVLGMFALPEIFDLIIKRGATIAEVDRWAVKQTGWAQVYEGIKDVFRNWWLFIRSSVIGTVIGIIPGVGADTAIFVAYGQAKQTSKHPELYGSGIIEGVIAPESANNSKEGGSFLPTLAFGIPGSLVMAVMLAGFLIHGIQPGLPMLTDHLDLTWTLIICLVVSNIIGVVLVLPFVSSFAKVAFVRGRLLIPIILVVATFGAYASNLEFWDILLTFVFGILAYLMIKSGYNRVAMLLGFVLGHLVETYLDISIKTHGVAFLVQPVSLILVIMIVLLVASDPVRSLIQKKKGRKSE